MALIELGSPELLLLAPLLITLTLLGHHFAHRIKNSLEVFHFPGIRRLNRILVKKGLHRSPWRNISLALKVIIIILVTFSLSNPTLLTFSEITETADVPMAMNKDVADQIVLVLDVSASMGITDVYPSRLEAAKSALIKFIQNSSETVRFGLVAFERDIKKALPLTDDKSRILSAVENFTAAEALPCLEEFTDLGYGLRTSVDLLAPYSSSSGNTAIILVSDGFTNYGYPNPYESALQAAARANATGIPVYAVHVAKLGQDSNDELLEQIAEKTGGKFMDSTNMKELEVELDIIGKYYVPTHEWSAKVEVKTTIPAKTSLGLVLMFVAAVFVLALWTGNYRHYKTSF